MPDNNKESTVVDYKEEKNSIVSKVFGYVSLLAWLGIFFFFCYGLLWIFKYWGIFGIFPAAFMLVGGGFGIISSIYIIKNEIKRGLGQLFSGIALCLMGFFIIIAIS